MDILFEIDDKPWDFRVYYCWINPVSIFEEKESDGISPAEQSIGWFLVTVFFSVKGYSE